MGNQYHLLLNDQLKSYFLGLPAKAKQRLKEKMEFLENGIWDSGVRVKKLKGLSRKVVFEARVSQGDRLLFTLGKERNRICVYLWAVVKHDDISKKAQVIRPDNAPFLHFSPSTETDYKELFIDELAESFFTQESLEEKIKEDYGPQKWLMVNEKEWKRILLTSEPDHFEIFLYLTPEQEILLKEPPPLLISGTAGSGKTTLSVYYLFKESFLNKKKLFITYSPLLKDFSQRIYQGLTNNMERPEQLVEPDFVVFHDLLIERLKAASFPYDPRKEVSYEEFRKIIANHNLAKKYEPELVWEEVRSIIKGAKPAISPFRLKALLTGYFKQTKDLKVARELVDYLIELDRFEWMSKIKKIIPKRTGFEDYIHYILGISTISSSLDDPSKEILNQIYKLVVKQTTAFASPLLTYEEYAALGEKRAPNFLYNRQEIYTLALYYQNKLEERGAYDELDLCRILLTRFAGNKQDKEYDLIICDEIQDFTNIHLSLIFRLVKDVSNTVLTGDPKQIINPSGFRWQEVKNEFYERGVKVPEVYSLNLNFRCVGNIVRLSNALLDIKQRLVGLSGYEYKEEWKFQGRPPTLISGLKEQELLEQLRALGAGQIILVKDLKEKKRIKKALNTELVFTIKESKGLEFDTVFLWKINQDPESRTIWRKVKNEALLEEHFFPHLRHEINLLYVAITRARNNLLIYDGPLVPEVWNLVELKPLIFFTQEKESLKEMWQRISTPQQWQEQAEYFFERKYYGPAAECFKNAGNAEKADICKAFIYAAGQQHKKAAELFSKYQWKKEAASHYELCEDYEKAHALWKQLAEKERALICLIKGWEKQGLYNQAAAKWLGLKREDQAVKNWEKAGNRLALAEYFYGKREYERAATYFEAEKKFSQAAESLVKGKLFEKAAEYYLKAREYRKAAVLYKKLKNSARLLESLIKAKDYYEAGILLEKKKEVESAIDCFKKFGEQNKENHAKILQEAQKFSHSNGLKSAVRYSALGRFELSAPLFRKKKQWQRALLEYETLEDWNACADIHEILGQHYEAALCLEKLGDHDDNRAIDQFFYYLHQDRAGYKKRANKLYDQADDYILLADYRKALRRFKVINYPPGILSCYQNLKADQEALEYFYQHDEKDSLEKYLVLRDRFNLSAEFLQKILSRPVSYSGWYSNMRVIRQSLALCKKQLRGEQREASLPVISRYLKQVVLYNRDLKPIGDELYPLLVETRAYDAIISLFKLYANNRKNSIKTFLELLQEETVSGEDKTLRACYFYKVDKEQYLRLLEEITPKAENITLFSESPMHWQKAVDYYAGNQLLNEAVPLCVRYQAVGQAAALLEEAGELKRAADLCRDHKLYAKALDLYEQIDDQAGMARVYERQKEFDKAISLWEALGKKRELERVKRKQDKLLDSSKQLELF